MCTASCYLDCKIPNGAKSTAIIYSIVETAIENRIKPIEYLTYLFDQLTNVYLNNNQVIDSLLPCSETLPLNFKLF